MWHVPPIKEYLKVVSSRSTRQVVINPTIPRTVHEEEKKILVFETNKAP